MMDEVNYKEDFTVEGPLWIQVQALEKGLEIIVTKAQVGKNGTHIEPINENEDEINISISEDKIDVKNESNQIEKIRSEERRVGKEYKTREGKDDGKKKN